MRPLLAILLLLSPLAAAERWQMQYFYDQAKTRLNLQDIAFPTPRRGIAVGSTIEGERTRGACLLTIDGGAHWTLTKLPAPARSVFFLDDSLGWVVTEKGIYQTDEGGRSWRKIKSPKDVLRVYFLDAKRGYAAGLRKSVFQTADGGASWTRLAAADEPKVNAEYTVYNWIAFATPQIGMITGYNRRPRLSNTNLPNWMEPEMAATRPEWPHVSISLETRDSGKNWGASIVSILGSITRVRLSPDGRGLGLVEFVDAFAYPSDVFSLRWKTGQSARGFRSRERAVTDMAIIPNGPGYLAAVETTGRTVRMPVPTALHILKSDNLTDWSEMEVDYRAIARRAVLASAGPGNLWVATDTGMILKLTE